MHNKEHIMGRCYICDWTPTGEQSDYNLNLAGDTGASNYLLEQSDKKVVCFQCATQAYLYDDLDIIPTPDKPGGDSST